MDVTMTVADVIQGIMLRRATSPVGMGDAIDYLYNRDIRETTDKKYVIHQDADTFDFKDTDDYGAASTTGSVAHSSDRTHPDWDFTFGNHKTLSFVVDPMDLLTYGITKEMLNRTVDSFINKDELKAIIVSAQPIIDKMLKKVRILQRNAMISALQTLDDTSITTGPQRPYGKPICAVSGDRTYHDYTNLFNVGAYDEALNAVMHDAFRSGQLDWENTDTIGMSEPQILLCAAGFSNASKIWSPEKVVNSNFRSVGDLNMINAENQKMIGTYKDTRSTHANDVIMIGPLAKIYTLGLNTVPGSKNGIWCLCKVTDEGGYSVSVKFNQVVVIEEPTDIMKNSYTLS